MPHYDESFFYDDNQNQRKNKRSYRVYKNGLNPQHVLEKSEVLHDLEERGKIVLKRNIKNIKHRSNRLKPEIQQNGKPSIYKTPDIIVDHYYPPMSVFDPNKFNDIRNNNFSLLTPCKSFDNLTLKNGKKKEKLITKIRNGISLQNLADDGTMKHYVSPVEDRYRVRREDAKNSYSVVEARCRPLPRRGSQPTPAPGVGVYRQISNDGTCRKVIPGMFSYYLLFIRLQRRVILIETGFPNFFRLG